MRDRVQAIGRVISSVRGSCGGRLVASVACLAAVSFSLIPSNSSAESQLTAPDAAQSESLRQSIQLYEKILQESPGTEQAARAQYRLGLTHLQLGEVEPGIAALRRTVAQYPNSAFAPMALEALSAHYRKQGDVGEATLAEKQLTEKYPQSIEAHKVWRDQGAALLRASAEGRNDEERWQKLEEAQRHFERILENNPCADLAAEAHLRIGYCVLSRSRSKPQSPLAYTDAIGRFEKFLNEFPTSPFAPEALGVLVNLYRQSKQRDKAEVLQQRLVRDYGKAQLAAPVFMQIGYFLQATQKREEAVPYFIHGVLADPDPQRLRTVAGMLSAVQRPASRADREDRKENPVEATYRSLLGAEAAKPYIALHRAFALLAQRKSSEALKIFADLAGVPQSEIRNSQSVAPSPSHPLIPSSVPWDVAAVAALEVLNRQHDSGQVGGAIEQYQSLLQSCADHGKDFLSARYQFAVAYQKSGRLEDAMNEFTRVFRDPAKIETCAQAGLGLARLYKEQKQSDKAMSVLDEVVQRFESLSLAADAQVLRAYLLEVQGKKNEAEKSLQEAALAHPEVAGYPAVLRLRLAKMLLEDNQTEPAIAHINELAGQVASLPQEIALEVADLQRMYGDASKAADQYEAVLTKTSLDAESRARATLKLAYAFGNQKQYQKALPLLRGIVHHREVSRELHATAQLEIGYLSAMEGSFRDALKELDRVDKLIPSSGLTEVRLKKDYWRGYCYRQLGEHEKAVEAYRRCYESPVDPHTEKVFEVTMMTARYEAGLALKAAGSIAEAREVFHELKRVGVEVHWVRLADLAMAEMATPIGKGKASP